MEIVIAWFWAVKLIIASITIYASYVAFWEKTFESKLWNICVFILMVLMIVMPLKIGVQTTQMQRMQDTHIEQNRMIPPRVTDNSFKENNNIDGIKEKDLK